MIITITRSMCEKQKYNLPTQMINKSLEENIYRLYCLGQRPKLSIQLW